MNLSIYPLRLGKFTSWIRIVSSKKSFTTTSIWRSGTSHKTSFQVLQPHLEDTNESNNLKQMSIYPKVDRYVGIFMIISANIHHLG